ncbi:MAG: hypothetical protein ACI3ZT_08870 [Candidatus Cryptobacteroides sp.]
MKRLLFISLLLGILPDVCARSRNPEVGIVSSPRSAGIAVQMESRYENISVLRIYADLYKVLDGHYSSPGYKADYHILFPLFDRKCKDDISYRITAGPGAAAGYARDAGKSCGVVAGVSAMASMDFSLRSFSVSLGFSAVLGCHLGFATRHENTLEWYKNGLTKAWIPEITIKYRF